MEFSLIVPILTPYNEKLEIDIQSLKTHCNYLQKYVDKIFIFGTSGEWPCITIDEKIKIVRTIIDVVPIEKLIVGVHSFNIKDTIKLVEECKTLNIKSIISLPPIYYKPSKEDLITYYEIICEKFENDVLLYIYPDAQGYSVPKEWILELLERCGNITGIKITCRDYKYILSLMKSVKEYKHSIKIYVGNGYYTLIHRAAEGDGVVDIFLNIVPKLYKEAIVKDDVNLHKKIIKIYEICRDFSLIRICKSVLKMFGIYSTDLTRFISREIPKDVVEELIRETEGYVIE